MANTDFERLNIVLAARDREFARAMDRNTRRIERFESRSKRSLSRTSGAFAALAKGAAALAPAIAAAVSVTAIQGAARMGKEVQNLANVAGIGVVEFQRLAVASQSVGISGEKLADIYKDINDRVGEFLQTGAGPMKDFFEIIAPQVGVTADEFARLSGPEALQAYVTSLERAGLSQQEMTFYLEAMASDTTALIPLLRDGGAEMKRLGDEAQEAGRIMSNDTVEALGDLDQELLAVKETIRAQFLDAVADSADEILVLADFVTDYGIPALEGLVGVAAGAADAFNLAASAVSEFVRLAKVAAGVDVATPGFDGAQYTDENGNPDNQDGTGGRSVDPSSTGLRTIDPATGEIIEFGMGGNTPEIPGVTAPTPLADIVVPARPGLTGGGGRSGGGRGGGAGRSVKEQVQDFADFDAVLRRVEASMGALGAAAGNYQAMLAAVDQLHAEGKLTAEEYRDAVGQIEDQFQGVIRAAENIKSVVGDVFVGLATGAMSAREAAQQLLGTLAQMAAQNAFGALLGNSGIFGTVASWFPNIGSFEGGGYTGGGSRSGGMDGKGGRLAMIHPQETIVDHTKGQTLGGGGQVTVYQTNTFQTDVAAAVRAELASYTPRLIEATKAAVADKARRSPNYKGAF